MVRAETAEEEVKKCKSGKAAQNGRIKDLHVENTALKKNARSELEAAENTANMNDKVRATALTDELVNRHYDRPSRIAATQTGYDPLSQLQTAQLLNNTCTPLASSIQTMSSSKDSTNNTGAQLQILIGQENYIPWVRDFKMTATSEGVWDFYQGTEEILAKPQRDDYQIPKTKKKRQSADAAFVAAGNAFG